MFDDRHIVNEHYGSGYSELEAREYERQAQRGFGMTMPQGKVTEDELEREALLCDGIEEGGNDE